MSIFHNNGLIGASGQGGGAGGYSISRSLRFNSSDSAYCSRVPSTAGNRKTWTWAGWVKRSALATRQIFFSDLDVNGDNGLIVEFDSSDCLNIGDFYSSVYSSRRTTTQVFRDPSAWQHIVISYDTTNATAGNRLRVYVNGVEVTAFSNTINPSQNYDGSIGRTNTVALGRAGAYPGFYYSGYFADVHFIDGQALTPSSFTETSATTGQLIPKAYTGSFGTNGFWLKFSDNSNNTATTLGKDYSGNGNNWTPNNLSVTAGAGNDSLVDTPTSYGTDTGVGGEVRGNYCTWNPLKKSGTAAAWTAVNGNLDLTWSNGNDPQVWGTIGFSAGKWYWEVTAGSIVSNSWLEIVSESGTIYAYQANTGNKYNGATAAQSAYGATWTTGDVIGVAVDADNGSIIMYKNGVSQGTMFSGLTLNDKSWFPGVHVNVAATATAWSANFGQRPFAYTAPSGFKALCDTNLPAPVVAKPNTVMDVKLYTGNGSTQTISGLGFSPDLVWIKGRSAVTNHRLLDTIRGATKELYSSTTDAETTQAQSLTAFNSDGFSLGSLAAVNESSQTFVAWTWDAGTTTASNPDGSITSSVRANTSAGFSIVSFVSGSTSSYTVGHGLNVAPEFIIFKDRDSGNQPWCIYHKTLGSSQYLLFTTQGALSSSWGGSPTSSVFYANTTFFVASKNIIAYAFAPVAGYSSFGSYTGNGSSDGPFVFCGFRPRWILTKRYDGGANGWGMFDALRPGYNLTDSFLQAQSSGSESTGASAYSIDILSNGFKVRGTDAFVNQSGGSYIFAAFAESPFAYARAR